MPEVFAPSERLIAHAALAKNVSELREDLASALAEEEPDMSTVFDLEGELELEEALLHDAYLAYTNPFGVDKAYHPPVG